MAGARAATVPQGPVRRGPGALVGLTGARLLALVMAVTLLWSASAIAGSETVPVLGQFGENRYAATEAMRRLQGILDLVYGEAALQPEYVSVPFNRAVQQVQVQPDSCLSAVTRTPETESQFLWLFPVTQTRVIVIVAAPPHFPDTDVSLETLRRNQADGIVSLDGAGQVVLQKADIRHDSRPAADTVVKMVAAGRVRYGVLLAVTFDLLDAADKSAVRVLGDLQVQTIWHACNTAFPPQQVDRLKAAHGRLQRDGRLRQLYTGFGLSQPRP